MKVFAVMQWYHEPIAVFSELTMAMKLADKLIKIVGNEMDHFIGEYVVDTMPCESCQYVRNEGVWERL